MKHWFAERNTRGRVEAWEIRRFFRRGNRTAVEWYFRNSMTGGRREEFDGVSLIEWAPDGRIRSLREFGCNLNNYDPYRDGDAPSLRDEKINWF